MLLAAPSVGAQATSSTGSTFDFSIPNMMRGPELYGRDPAQIRWTPDSRWIYFRWLPPGTDWRETPRAYRVRAEAGATPEPVSDAQMDSVGPLLADGPLTPDRSRRVVSYEGDLYLVDRTRNNARRLTQTLDTERSPSFSTDGKDVYFLRGDNLYSLGLDSGLLRQLTDVRQGDAPAAERKPAPQRAFLEQEQLSLLQVIRDEARTDSIRAATRARDDSARVLPLHLGRTERLAGVAVAPTGTALLLSTNIPSTQSRRTAIPEFVTKSGYTEEIPGRTKVGDVEGTGRVGFMRLPSGQIEWLKLLPGDSAGAPTFVRLMGWNERGDAALLWSTSPDFKKRFIHEVDASGNVRLLDELTDTAWVAGPCSGCAGWVDGGNTAWFVSEADGYAHIYSVPRGGGERRQLTSGRWEVLGVDVSDDGRTFLLTTNEGSPFEQHHYRMAVSGGERTRVTSEVGGHNVTVSPDGRKLADVYSTANRPPELFVMDNRPGAKMSQLTTSPTADWLSHPWVKPEIVMVPASDGIEVPARIYTPDQWGAQPNGAAVIFVHGAGYLHNVHNYWSTYSREYMFNQYLASKGYVVLDMDYRGSAGYGRDWRTAIYRHMGGRDLQDHVDGSRYLTQRFGIDPERVGLYGGSYGGFITLMALFNAPKSFGAGAALRSVTDWAHYNNGYTGRILNLPQNDSIAYRQSSPIYFAEGLEDPLLMAHGMVDVNVHFQDIVRLSQRLIELGKTDWELAVYPVEDHGFVRPTSWADEYRRIFEIFERALVDRGAGSAQR